jgi:hypothetical protein
VYDPAEFMVLKQKGWDTYMIKLVFEQFCIELGAVPIDIAPFITKMENGFWRISMVNFSMNDHTAKALACILPYLVQVEEFLSCQPS